MKTQKLHPETFFEQWSSEARDLREMTPLTASRILFDIVLSNQFEHALLRLKADDCVWGPVHTSVGQEGVAAGVVAALRRSDKMVATYRAHHEFLAKALQFVLPVNWDPLSGTLPEEGQDVLRRTLAE
ncbi:MAG TPA: MFS transporter, partial [Bacteroidota bacterium]|nr:MFS transporter [Bacteroidota bacterium]